MPSVSPLLPGGCKLMAVGLKQLANTSVPTGQIDDVKMCFSSVNLTGTYNVRSSFHGLSAQPALILATVTPSQPLRTARHHSRSGGECAWELGMEPASGPVQCSLGGPRAYRYTVRGSGGQEVMRDYVF